MGFSMILAVVGTEIVPCWLTDVGISLSLFALVLLVAPESVSFDFFLKKAVMLGTVSKDDMCKLLFSECFLDIRCSSRALAPACHILCHAFPFAMWQCYAFHAHRLHTHHIETRVTHSYAHCNRLCLKRKKKIFEMWCNACYYGLIVITFHY